MKAGRTDSLKYIFLFFGYVFSSTFFTIPLIGRFLYRIWGSAMGEIDNLIFVALISFIWSVVYLKLLNLNMKTKIAVWRISITWMIIYTLLVYLYFNGLILINTGKFFSDKF